LLILSTEANQVVAARCRKLGLPCIQDCPDKLAALAGVLSERGLRAEQVGFVGNDVNDSSCLAAVGLPVVVQDAHPEVLPLAAYRTQARGGHGAVREVCDLFLTVCSPRQVAISA